ncbi:MAG TPA: hypothetical protein VMD28_03820, partial [Acidimicrobiales bacterium]|nr:hypothetical protein [Acidimicrobiales bacterium]
MSGPAGKGPAPDDPGRPRGDSRRPDLVAKASAPKVLEQEVRRERGESGAAGRNARFRGSADRATSAHLATSA